MEQFKVHMIRFWKDYLISFIIALILGVVIFLLFFLLRSRTLYDALNAATMSGVIILCFGGLIFISSFGFFDLLSYGANQTLHFVFGRKANKYHDYPNYVEEKRKKREHSAHIFIPFLIVSILFFIAVFALEICMHN